MRYGRSLIAVFQRSSLKIFTHLVKNIDCPENIVNVYDQTIIQIMKVTQNDKFLASVVRDIPIRNPESKLR